MTAQAAARELTMLRVRFRRMARGACGSGRGARVWLMTLQTRRVTRRSAVRFLPMAAFAPSNLRPTVRFVAARALRMAREHGVLLGGVTGRAVGLCGGMMRQPGVAAGTVSVAHALADRAHLARMTATAKAAVGLGQGEFVRLVAASTRHRSVKALIAVGGLVTAAARLRRLGQMPRSWVRVMAADAAASSGELGVVGVHVLVTVDAGRRGAAAHVVGSVATGAGGVRGDLRRGQGVHLGVARATGQSLLLAELVRLVTAHALDVAFGEQSRFRDNRLLAGVAGLAAGKRSGSRSVLVLVACRAHLLGCLAERGVLRLDVTVAACTRPRLRRGVFVDVVTTHTLGSAVHDHGWSGPLCRSVTTHAVLGLEISMRGDAAGCGTTDHPDTAELQRRKFMAVGAVGFRSVAKALDRLELGVSQTTLLLMARGAARWRSDADRVALQNVALGAGQLLLNDVHLVPDGRARALPSRLHVQVLGWRPRIQARRERGQRDRKRRREQRTMGWRHPPAGSISALYRE